MNPGEVSQTPRKDGMGMDMVPVYEAEGSMLELSDHARAMASVETVPVQRRTLGREIRAIGCVAVSTGSACHTGATAISPVLKAMGVSPDEISTSIRFSLGRPTTENEIDVVLDNLSSLTENSHDYAI